MAAKIEYRRAQPLDLINVLRLLKAEHAIITIPFPVMDEAKTLAHLVYAINQGQVWVSTLSGRIIGALVCTIEQPRWSVLFVLVNDFFVVDQHFRKHGVAQNLLKLAKAFADEKKLPFWGEVTTGGDDAMTRDRFLAMQGLTYMGGRFLYWPKELPTKG